MKFIRLLTVLSFITLSDAMAEIDVIQYKFIQLDLNGDGLISKQEHQEKLELFRFTSLYSQGDFMLADINQDGFIDIKEYVASEEITY